LEVGKHYSFVEEGKSMRKLGVLAVLAIVGVFMFAATSGAVSVYSDFGPSDAYNTDTGYDITGSTSDLNVFGELAEPFTPGFDCVFSDVLLALGNSSGTNQAEVTLAADNAGEPGATIESLSLTGLAGFGSLDLVQANSVLNPDLLAGDQYWIVVAPSISETSDTNDVWNFNSTGVADGYSFNSGSGWNSFSGFTTPAFEVDAVGGVSAVPEPATMTLLGLGIAGLIGRRIRRRK
jgi:hypothetical protein